MKITRASGFGCVVTSAFQSPGRISPVELGLDEFIKAVREQVIKNAKEWLVNLGSHLLKSEVRSNAMLWRQKLTVEGVGAEELANDISNFMKDIIREYPSEKGGPTVRAGQRLLDDILWLDAGGPEKRWQDAEPQREKIRAELKHRQEEEYAVEYPKVMEAPWRQPRYRQDTE
jgi:hypothetical protein